MNFINKCGRGALVCLAKLPGILIYLAAAGITIFLVNELTQGQSPVIIGIAMLAILIESFLLLYARSAWQSGNRPEAVAGYAGWFLAGSLLVLLELGYYQNDVAVTHEQYTERHSQEAAKQVILDRDRKAIANGILAESSAQIKAQMDAQLTRDFSGKTLGVLTRDCADSQAWAYRFCNDYLNLKGKHAAALKIEAVEQRIWSGVTRTEAPDIRKNIFAGAEVASRNLGGTVEFWVSVIMGLLVAILFFGRGGSLWTTFPSRKTAWQRYSEAHAEKARIASGATEALGAITVAPQPVPPALRAPSHAETAFAPSPGKDPDFVPAPPPPKPDPAPEEVNPPLQEVGQLAKVPARLVVDNDVVTKTDRRAKAKKKRIGVDASEIADVNVWFEQIMRKTNSKRQVTTGEALENYLEYCAIRDLTPVHHKKLSAEITKRLGKKRGGKGAIWKGYYLEDPAIEKLKARA